MPKHIVLLSDGTGNSAAKPFKTNVWRLYQALDLMLPTNPNAPRQIALYDNGVGTENFKPLALLGGAVGLGVWKNVKDLYTFVCRNHDVGDQIYGFGFSRGAFTIRLLMGLIGKCGIVKPDPHSEANLTDAVQMAYEAYRRDFLVRASKKQGMIYHHVLRGPTYHLDDAGQATSVIALPVEQRFVDIAFVGVWDTVDAYGMPVDELKLAIDRWVWPMSFADRTLSTRINAARHALSLDDERPTFRPVLWNEVVRQPGDPARDVTLGPERIQQVWFSGVHANVGGGYADDSLAHVALDWMMQGAEAAQLRFCPGAREAVREHADPHGQQYDSRSGVAGYYRYGPRRVKELCEDAEHGVSVPTVRVHADVFDRIARHQVEYAPVSLNTPFELTGGSPNEYPPPELLAPDNDALETAWDVVWWRRQAYFATVALSLVIALFALAAYWPPAKVVLRAAEGVLASALFVLTEPLRFVYNAVAGFVPGWLAPLIEACADYPLTATASLAILAWLLFFKSVDLQHRISARAEWAWDTQKGLPADGLPGSSWLNRVARGGRKVTAALYRIWRRLAVDVLGILIGIVALVLLSPYWLWRIARRPKWMAAKIGA